MKFNDFLESTYSGSTRIVAIRRPQPRSTASNWNVLLEVNKNRTGQVQKTLFSICVYSMYNTVVSCLRRGGSIVSVYGKNPFPYRTVDIIGFYTNKEYVFQLRCLWFFRFSPDALYDPRHCHWLTVVLRVVLCVIHTCRMLSISFSVRLYRGNTSYIIRTADTSYTAAIPNRIQGEFFLFIITRRIDFSVNVYVFVISFRSKPYLFVFREICFDQRSIRFKISGEERECLLRSLNRFLFRSSHKCNTIGSMLGVTRLGKYSVSKGTRNRKQWNLKFFHVNVSVSKTIVHTVRISVRCRNEPRKLVCEFGRKVTFGPIHMCAAD